MNGELTFVQPEGLYMKSSMNIKIMQDLFLIKKFSYNWLHVIENVGK